MNNSIRLIIRSDTAKIRFCRDTGFGLCRMDFMPCRKMDEWGRLICICAVFDVLKRKNGF